MKNTKIILVCFVISITIMGCYTKKRVGRLVTLNPTSYVFNASIEQVKNAIKSGCGNYQVQCMSLYSKEDYEVDIFNTDIKKDALLIFHCDIESKIYFRFGKPLDYYVNFHIHLDSIFEDKTKVEIFTLNPEIEVFWVGIGHFGFGWDKKVPPSTIEEYEILLIIGKELGEKGMPACNYPEKWLKYREKHPSVGKRW